MTRSPKPSRAHVPTTTWNGIPVWRQRVPISPTIGWIGVTNTVLAPFGAFAINLAAITAAICMGREAHEDAGRRYVAAIAAGVFYLIVGLFGATVAALFAAFPQELIVAIAGFALLGTIGNSLAAALRVDDGAAVRPLAAFAASRIGVVMADLAVRNAIAVLTGQSPLTPVS